MIVLESSCCQTFFYVPSGRNNRYPVQLDDFSYSIFSLSLLLRSTETLTVLDIDAFVYDPRRKRWAKLWACNKNPVSRDSDSETNGYFDWIMRERPGFRNATATPGGTVRCSSVMYLHAPGSLEHGDDDWMVPVLLVMSPNTSFVYSLCYVPEWKKSASAFLLSEYYGVVREVDSHDLVGGANKVVNDLTKNNMHATTRVKIEGGID